MQGPIIIKPDNQNNSLQNSTSNAISSVYVATNEDFKVKWDLFKSRFDENRFFIPGEDELIAEYLNQIVNRDKPNTVLSGEVFYRARINDTLERFEISDFKAPWKEIASYGRLNPKNIPYLYVSDSLETVIAEVRPYIGATVEIAKCTLSEEINIIDLTKSDKDDNTRINNFRKMLSEFFSIPHSPRDTEKEYLPTQYIAEYIKEQGFGGVKYKSAVNKSGVNICLFDTEIVVFSLFDVKRIEHIEYY